MSTFSHRLRWDEIDPATHPFDTTGLRGVVKRTLAPYELPGEGTSAHRDLAEEAMTRALVVEYGAWVMCWTWASSEPGGGGPVSSWCCGNHSLDTDRMTAEERVVTAVLEWRGVLERLEVEFSTLHRECAGLSDGETAMRGAARLLPLILEWTTCQDAWYGTVSTILAWFLEPRRNDRDRTDTVIREAIRGLFNSHTEPSERERADAIGAIGVRIDADTAREPERDALVSWRRTRGWVQWIEATAPLRPRTPRDGHLAFIESHDRAQAPLRAARMKEALERARGSVVRGDALTFALLQSWQRIVLGSDDVEFRRGDAFAKNGAERYGVPAEGWAAFDDCLQQASADAPDAVARAVRVYLDTCFFHPFNDGNGRAARLAFDFVLTRGGLWLYAAEPVFLLARLANDWAGAYTMQAVVESVVCPISA